MVNAWSLLYDELYGDDKMTDENRVTPQESDEYDPIKTSIDLGNGITISGLEDGISISTNPDDYEHSQYWYDYNRNDLDMPNPFATDPLADNDDQIAHHIQINTSANSTEGVMEKINSEKRDYRYKYHEKEIFEDLETYISSTYNGHYTGTSHEYRNVQTLDLMAAQDIASGFCQANILKYGSRYGSKDGKNKRDLMKVIHYAMLLLHFDGHYKKSSECDGNFEQMP
tara:strand:+ start:176 stop:856 length:681 start_codon:yes stop_codon:yes gene_type:complete